MISQNDFHLSFQIKERQMKNTWRNKRSRGEKQQNVICLDCMLDLLY